MQQLYATPMIACLHTYINVDIDVSVNAANEEVFSEATTGRSKAIGNWMSRKGNNSIITLAC